MTLLDLTLAAESDVATYRHPDIADWRAAIDPVLKAAGESTIGTDTVEDITLSNDTLTIETSYTVMGCPDSSTLSIPRSILTAEDPVKAANQYRLTQALAVAKSRIAEAQRAVTENTAKVAAIEAELAALI